MGRYEGQFLAFDLRSNPVNDLYLAEGEMMMGKSYRLYTLAAIEMRRRIGSD